MTTKDNTKENTMIERPDCESFAREDWDRLQRFEDHLVHGRILRARLLRWWTLRRRRRGRGDDRG
jgi:hypothetical protein